MRELRRSSDGHQTTVAAPWAICLLLTMRNTVRLHGQGRMVANNDAASMGGERKEGVTPMPCDTVRTTLVEVEKMDGPLLQAALRSLGYQVSVQGQAILFSMPSALGVNRYENGRMMISNVYDQTTFVNTIKQAYSTEVVKSTAKRFGWALKQDAKQTNKFSAIRRG